MSWFCKHDYLYYNLDYTIGSLGYKNYGYKFVCKNCGKTKTVWVSDINSQIEYYKDQYKKAKVLNKIGEIESSSIYLKQDGIGCVSIGAWITILCNEYKKQGIDLKQATDFVKNHV